VKDEVTAAYAFAAEAWRDPGCEKRIPAEKREYIRHCRPPSLSIAEGCRLMGIARSAFYDLPTRTRPAARGQA
jgi:hypothetical protein